jgi:hypothetical protein
MRADSTQRFSDRADHYVRARPNYPQAFFDFLRADLGLAPAWSIADIGSGTGISARPFLENGNTVYAIEPNAAMRLAAERILSQFFPIP